MRILKHVVCVVLLVIAASACHVAGALRSGVRFYEGQPRAVSDVAILAQATSGLWLMKVDGRSRSYSALNNRNTGWNIVEDKSEILVEFLPGEHTLEFRYQKGTKTAPAVAGGTVVEESMKNQVVVFTAKPGTLYGVDVIMSNRGRASDTGAWLVSVRERGPIPAGFARPTDLAVSK
jgi:hypothetical protein